jgi:hypothetical protein
LHSGLPEHGGDQQPSDLADTRIAPSFDQPQTVIESFAPDNQRLYEPLQ